MYMILKSGYHHVEVVKAHRKYLGFDGPYVSVSPRTWHFNSVALK